MMYVGFTRNPFIIQYLAESDKPKLTAWES